ncbi:MAG: phosphoribosylformylglycinamidine synthase II [Spirochaetes bacterium GWF1_51_8]|nr:MAG: phosphoribosylformylglycinamidine synthase II [Spirochaetes bacterium GWF1_51_8]
MTFERAAELSGLSQSEIALIEKLLDRKPTLEELGMFGALWSEHCGYKNTKPMLKKLPTSGKHLIQGPGENAGVVGFDDYAIVFKIESHNHPSAVEPYQGAATGVGGILRDIFAMGAMPIAMVDSLRFGKRDSKRTRYLVGGVIAGISDYGNRVGVPTVAGELVFEDSYEGNPLVNVMCVGLAKKDGICKATATGEGNLLFYYGSKTGRDGLGGATFASAELSSEGEDKRPSVQVGDAFMEKLILGATLELIDKKLVVGIQDMGAAGITSSSCEMAARGNSSIEIDIDTIPAREPNMIAYEFLLSESQERMLAVIEPKMLDKVVEVMKKYEIDYAVIGKVTSAPSNSPRVVVKEHGKTVVDLPIGPLVHDVPTYVRDVIVPDYLAKANVTPQYTLKSSYNDVLKELLADPNIASKEWVYERYDHHVQTNLLAEPVMAGGAMLRVKGTTKGIGIAVDGNGRYTYLDPYTGGMQAVAEACRNISCMGAEPYGITNCLNFGNPEKPMPYYQLVKAIEGMGEACRKLEAPVTGGNASLYNETDGEPILPTIVVGAVGVIDDYKHAMFNGFKNAGDKIALIGTNKDEIGGSLFLVKYAGKVAGKCPSLDIGFEVKLQKLVRDLVNQQRVHSAQDISDGGLAVALAECAINSGRFGAEIDLMDDISLDALLFGESQSRILVSYAPGDHTNNGTMHEICLSHDVPMTEIGSVTDTGRIVIKVKGKTVIDLSLAEAEKAYHTRYIEE